MPYRRSKQTSAPSSDLLDSPDRIWETALDQLEVQLNRAERLVRLEQDTDGDVLGWTPPAAPVSMPRYLMPRAKALLERQQVVIERLPELIERTREQVRLTDRVGQATTPVRPSAYVDISA